MFFGEYFQTDFAKSGSGYKPVLHSIAATNTIWIVTSFYTGSKVILNLIISNNFISILRLDILRVGAC